MKNYLFLFIATLGIVSCQDDVEFNNTALQASINNNFWEANLISATFDSATGILSISGSSKEHNVDLMVSSKEVGSYVLGTTNQDNKAVYSPNSPNDDSVFTTGISQNSVNAVLLTEPGSGYTAASLVATSGGSGTGLKVNISTNTNDTSGKVTEVTINVPGQGYKAGDIVTIVGGNQDAKITVQNTINSNGQVIITENTGTTISGSFKFVAFDEVTGDLVSCQNGIFYKLPITTK